jgi:tRNA dimethylallyltransferase
MKKDKIVFLVGPTAVGKTAVAVHLAKKAGAEIISCDSMQVYKGMDIITSKPGPALRKKTIHYLIDIVKPTAGYDVSRFRSAAAKLIEYALKRGKLPLFVGGTGLYMSVLLDGIFEGGRQDQALRNKLQRLAQAKGVSYLYNRLRRVDPEAARKIHHNDLRRVVRALEVFETSGEPISRMQQKRRGISADYDITILCLNMEREQLYRRIEERVDEMFKKGLTKEVLKLLRFKLSKTAACAIGIKELKGYFDGIYDIEEAKRLIKLNTRRYAKRQLSWFRRDKRVNWINVDIGEKPGRIAHKIWKKYF